MNQTVVVYKYALQRYPGESALMVPRGAEFLTVEVVREEVVAYFRLPADGGDVPERWPYVVVYTGQPQWVNPGFRYARTVMLDGGHLVLHFWVPVQAQAVS